MTLPQGQGGGSYHAPQKKKKKTSGQKHFEDFFMGSINGAKKKQHHKKVVAAKKKAAAAHKAQSHNYKNLPTGGGRAPEDKVHYPSKGHSSGGGGGGGHSAPKHHPAPKHHKGGGKKHGGGGGGGGGGGNLRKQASRIVQSDINNAVRALENEKKTRKGDLNFSLAKLDAMLRRSKGDLNHIYGEANENTAIQNAKINNTFNQGRAGVRATYGDLQNRLAANTQANASAGNAELARMGIQQAGLGRLGEDAANASNVAGINAANADTNLSTQQSGAAQIGGMLASMGTSSQAAAVGRATNARNDGVSEAMNAYRQDVAGIYDQERSEQLAKGGKVQELWQQMDDRRFQRKESNRNYALARRSQAFSENSSNNNFALSVSRFNSDNLWKSAAQRQEDRRQAALLRQQAAAAMAGGR